ncbi:dihydromonapterin reductase [Pseudoalteromonas sp. MMG024]|uniref:dihydromonapterin reductase n=1 Tax=Pseudoalteromonas sp. MMG024 TaxID=2909980 RepID=UPI001F02120C|nr:dihydromonapterin reductase [Pseudoalteromonas sp. MMG024]MCF6458350.1 dihydromonapterin reductase [Pseudoalteromonas sp. MMG024]
MATILITGAAQRIGLDLAKHFLNKGDKLIITYRTKHASVNELLELGAICLACDFEQSDAVEKLVEQVKSHTNELSAIIHNASSWDCESKNPDFNSLFDNMMNIHAKVPYLLNLALMPLLQNSSDEHSNIIHITDYVVEKGSPKHIAYAASKAALDNLTRSFSAKLAPKVKVNSIAPSLIIFNDHDDDAYRAKTLKKSIMALEPGTAEVINGIEMILNSNYMTGRTLQLDGGRHLK